MGFIAWSRHLHWSKPGHLSAFRCCQLNLDRDGFEHALPTPGFCAIASRRVWHSGCPMCHVQSWAHGRLRGWAGSWQGGRSQTRCRQQRWLLHIQQHRSCRCLQNVEQRQGQCWNVNLPMPQANTAAPEHHPGHEGLPSTASNAADGRMFNSRTGAIH